MKIKCFDTQVINHLDYDIVLRMLKAAYREENKKIISENDSFDLIDNVLLEAIQEIQTTYPAYESRELEQLLINKNCQNLLYENSRYYFVTPQLWEIINKLVFEKALSEFEHFLKNSDSKNKRSSDSPKKSSNNEEIYKTYLKDWAIVSDFYNKKVLVIDVS